MANTESWDWTRFYPGVKGRHNVLHDYNLYNYNFALVALSANQLENPDSYKNQIFTNGKENPGFYVVARSGGYGRDNSTGGYKQSGGSRDKDIFIQTVRFETVCGINSMGNSNLTRGTMTFVEPFGVAGLYEELFAAAKFAKHENYIRAPFLLVVTFVGRTVDGDAVIPEKTTRHIPIMFTKSDMTVTEAGAEYNAEFVAYNAMGGSNINQTLWDDVEGRTRETETVESVLTHLFYQQNEKYEKMITKTQESEQAKGKNASAFVAERIDKAREIRGQSGKGSEVPIDAFVPEKWCIWFAQDYSSFPPTVGPGTKMTYKDWKTKAEFIIDTEKSTPGSSSAPFTNKFAEANFDTDSGFIPTPGLKIKDFDKSVDDETDKIKAEQDKIKTAQGVLTGTINAYKATKKSLVATAKLYITIPEEKKSSSPDIKATSAPKFLIEETTKQTQELEKIATSVALTPPTVQYVKDDQPPANTTPTTKDTPTVATLMAKITELDGEIKKQAGEIKKAQEAIEASSKTVGTLKATPYTLFGEKASPWSFKKGFNLSNAIHLLIANSSYMKLFTDAGKVNEIAQSEYIPWYKIDIVPRIIAFDVVKMDFAYEYHFIVSPYDIHYSKFPGLQIIFSTRKLRERAVREYNYTYTGKNLDVLRFDVRYNNLFFTPMLLVPPEEEASSSTENAVKTNNAFMPKTMYQDAINNLQNGVSNYLGASGGLPSQMIEKSQYRRTQVTNRAQIAQTLQDFLYNPPAEQALIRAEITIIGDPVYIIGSGITERPKLNSTDPIVEDTGEMNTFTREPDIVFSLRYPDDIPTASELEQGVDVQQRIKEGGLSGLYQVVKIENMFEEGTFTQTIHGLRRPNQEKDYENPGRRTFLKTDGSDNKDYKANNEWSNRGR